MPEDLSAYDGLALRIKGDGRRYKLIVRTSRDWDTIGYTAGFDTVNDQWQSVSKCISFGYQILRIDNNFLLLYYIQVRLPFSSLRPIFRARTVSDASPFDPREIISLQACSITICRVLPLFTFQLKHSKFFCETCSC